MTMLKQIKHLWQASDWKANAWYWNILGFGLFLSEVLTHVIFNVHSREGSKCIWCGKEMR